MLSASGRATALGGLSGPSMPGRGRPICWIGRAYQYQRLSRRQCPLTAPTITGTAQVGGTLTAETTGIADTDGLDNASFAYQWLADDADISGATGKTYALTEADEGKTVKVQVSFTDDAGNEETLTSTATDAVAGLPNSPATGAPTITGMAQVGGTLTAETTGIRRRARQRQLRLPVAGRRRRHIRSDGQDLCPDRGR